MLIHVETQALYETATQMQLGTVDMLELAHTVQRLAGRLDQAWQAGDASEQMCAELRQVCRRLEANLEELEQLRLALVRKANAWEATDTAWARFYRESFSFNRAGR